MRGYYLVHYRHPFEKDVHDVEGGEQPLVLAVGKLEVICKAGDFCIADVRSVQET